MKKRILAAIIWTIASVLAYFLYKNGLIPSIIFGAKTLEIIIFLGIGGPFLILFVPTNADNDPNTHRIS